MKIRNNMEQVLIEYLRDKNINFGFSVSEVVRLTNNDPEYKMMLEVLDNWVKKEWLIIEDRNKSTWWNLTEMGYRTLNK